jgi:hypothetical protein
VNIFKILNNMKITKHYCPNCTEELLNIFPDPRGGALSIKRIKGDDYFIEFFDSNGKMIISCNYPSYMQSKTFDLGMYKCGEYIIRVSNLDGDGLCMYRIIS